MSMKRSIRPEPYVGARVRLLGGNDGRIIARDHGTPGKWVIEIRDHVGARHLSTWPGEFHVVTDPTEVPS